MASMNPEKPSAAPGLTLDNALKALLKSSIRLRITVNPTTIRLSRPTYKWVSADPIGCVSSNGP
jgi:hypothetical protein